MKRKTELTKLEKILIDHFLLYPEEITFQDMYLISHANTKVSETNLAGNVSKWKNSDLVQSYMKQALTKIENTIDNRIREKTTIGENGERVFLQNNEINFTNLGEFIGYLNTKANNLTDEKERQKYLQMLSDLLRFKDQDTKDNDIIRFYMPFKCLECPFKKGKND